MANNINHKVQQFLQKCDLFEKILKTQLETMIIELMDPILKLEMQISSLFKRQIVSTQLADLIDQLQDDIEKNMNYIQDELQEVIKSLTISIKRNQEKCQIINEQFKTLTYQKLPDIKFSYNFSQLDEKKIEAHKKSSILQLVFEQKSGLIISSSEDSNVLVWDIRQLSSKQKLLGHSSWVRQLKVIYYEDKTYLITGGDDRQVIVWSKYGKRFIKERQIEFTTVTTYIRAMEGAILDDTPVAILGTGKNEGYCLMIICLLTERRLQRIQEHENTFTIVKLVRQDKEKLELVSCDMSGVNNSEKVYKWRCNKNSYVSYCDVSDELIVFGLSNGLIQIYGRKLKNYRLNCVYEHKFGNETIVGVKFIDWNKICVVNGQRILEILELDKRNVMRLVLKNGFSSRITAFGLDQEDGVIAVGDNFGNLQRIMYERRL